MSRETIINPGRFQNPSSTPIPTPPTTSSLPPPAPPPKKNRWIQMEKTKLSEIALEYLYWMPVACIWEAFKKGGEVTSTLHKV